MVICPKCGATLEDGKHLCSNCGHDVGDTPSAAATQPFTQQPVQTFSPAVNMPPIDSGNFGWAVLGFFIPIVGLVLYLVWRDEKPSSAKMAGLGALVSVAISIVFSILAFIVPLFFLGTLGALA